MSSEVGNPNAIVRFNGPNKFLSNFQASTISYQGCRYPTVEHAYQAQKSIDPLEQERIRNAISASQAKKMGKVAALRGDWDEIKASLMLELVRLKFENPFMRYRLMGTGNAILIEGNTWHDTFFGVCNCPKHMGEGQNVLGKILMQVRDEIKEEIAREEAYSQLAEEKHEG